MARTEGTRSANKLRCSVNFGAMFWRLFILFSVAAFAACKTVDHTTVTEKSDQQSTRYQIQIQFASVEDVKMVPLQYEKFRMQLNEELLHDQHLYRASIECKPYEIDGVIKKMKQDEGVIDVSRVE